MKKQRLTQFDYLREKEFNRLTGMFLQVDTKNTYAFGAFYDYMAQLKVFGFSIESVRFPYTGKTKKKDKNIFNYGLEFSIEFNVKNKPLEKYEKESEIVKKILKKHSYTYYYPYLSWATKEGKNIREIIDTELSKQGLKQEYKKWQKEQIRKKKIFENLIASFKKFKKSNLLFFYDEKREIFIIKNETKYKNKKRHIMTREEKEKIAKTYYKEISKFVEYINQHFQRIDF